MKLFILPILIACAVESLGQPHVHVELKTGYASSHMEDLKNALRIYKMNAPVPVVITDDFQPFFTFGGTAMIAFHRWELGLDFNYLSAGGRAHYKDYSGETGFDILATARSVGFVGRYTVIQKSKVSGFVSTLISGHSSDFEFNEFLYIGDDKQDNGFDARSFSFLITPMIGANYKINTLLYAGARLGFSLDTVGGLHLKGNPDAHIVNDDGDQLLTNWSGFKTELAIGVKLGKSKN